MSLPCTSSPNAGATGYLSVTDDAEWGGVSEIALSGQPDDSGVLQFALNDPRYLPFEGVDPGGSTRILDYMRAPFGAL